MRARGRLRTFALIGAGAIAAVGCTSGSGNGKQAGGRVEPSVVGMTDGSGAATGAVLRIDPATNKVAAQTYAVGKDPMAVAVGDGSVWVADAGGKSILRLDSAAGKGQATIVLGQQPRGIAISGIAGVWVNTLNRVWKIDPVSNDVVLKQGLGEPSGSVATGQGSVWVTGLFFGLGRVDSSTGLLDPDFSVGQILCSVCGESDGARVPFGGPWSGDHRRGAPPSVATGLGSVWVVGAPPPSGPSSVWRVDPSTGSSTPIRVPFGAVGAAVGENAVWAVGTNGEVARIDPERNEVVKLIETGSGATQVGVGFGAAWVLNPMMGTVTRIDPGTNAVIATIDVGAGTNAIAAGEGSVWVTRRAG
jgi:streptogramin lyase